MGFEQLAELRKQLSNEAKSAQRQAAGTQAAKSTRPAHPRTSGRGAAKTETVDPVVRIIGRLQKRFPAAFPKSPAPKVPLKIGILADLLAHAEKLELNEAEIRDAVSTWCRGSRYWACLIEGATRLDLTGAAAGIVAGRDAAFARRQAKGASGARLKDRHGPRTGRRGGDMVADDSGANGELPADRPGVSRPLSAAA